MADDRGSSTRGGDAPERQSSVSGVNVTVTGPPFCEYTWPLPKIVIDGTAQKKIKWGRSSLFTVSPGRHRIEVSFWFIKPRAGHAEIEIDQAPGQVRRLKYAAPRNAFLKGKITEE